MLLQKTNKGKLSLGRFQVPYRVYGSGDVSLVCVSGAQQTMAAWRSCIRYFSKKYSVVVFDLPGLGGAKILDGEASVHIDEQIEILDRVIRETTAGSHLILCGASWGSMIACAYAAKYPDRVDKLILGSFGLSLNEELRGVLSKGFDLHDGGQMDQVAHLILERFGQKVKGVYRAGIIRQFQEIGKSQALTLYHHCAFVNSCGSVDQFIDLKAITAKTLIVNGEDDTIIDADDAKLAAEQIPNCEFMIIPEAGHFLHIERSDILDIYDEFVRS
ncbi:MAG: alpha/beta hydrolase [Verrucomicrobiota bacterium]